MTTKPPTGHRPGKFVHDAFRAGIRLRAKTWGKRNTDPRNRTQTRQERTAAGSCIREIN